MKYASRSISTSAISSSTTLLLPLLLEELLELLLLEPPPLLRAPAVPCSWRPPLPRVLLSRCGQGRGGGGEPVRALLLIWKADGAVSAGQRCLQSPTAAAL
jgi:hypothetical protein